MSPSTGDEALFPWGEYHVGGNKSGNTGRTLFFAHHNRGPLGYDGRALRYVVTILGRDESTGR
jgi:hypothetical protein